MANFNDIPSDLKHEVAKILELKDLRSLKQVSRAMADPVQSVLDRRKRRERSLLHDIRSGDGERKYDALLEHLSCRGWGGGPVELDESKYDDEVFDWNTLFRDILINAIKSKIKPVEYSHGLRWGKDDILAALKLIRELFGGLKEELTFIGPPGPDKYCGRYRFNVSTAVSAQIWHLTLHADRNNIFKIYVCKSLLEIKYKGDSPLDAPKDFQTKFKTFVEKMQTIKTLAGGVDALIELIEGWGDSMYGIDLNNGSGRESFIESIAKSMVINRRPFYHAKPNKLLFFAPFVDRSIIKVGT